MSTLKLLVLTGLIGISVSGCILPPDDYSRRSVVRYNQPYPQPYPVYQDRYYSTERIYVPTRVRQRIYVDESPLIYQHRDDRYRHSGYWQRGGRDDDRSRQRHDWSQNQERQSNTPNRQDRDNDPYNRNRPNDNNTSNNGNKPKWTYAADQAHRAPADRGRANLEQPHHEQRDESQPSKSNSTNSNRPAKPSTQNVSKRLKNMIANP